MGTDYATGAGGAGDCAVTGGEEMADPFLFGERGGAPQMPYAGAVLVARGVDERGRPVFGGYVVVQRPSGHYRVAEGPVPLNVPLARGTWLGDKLIVTSAAKGWGLPRTFRRLR